MGNPGPVTRQRIFFGLGMVVNFLLPWAVYRLSEPRVGETRAIITSAVVPMAWSLVQLARSRKVDVMSAIVLGGIGLSLVVLAFGGSPKLLLIRGALFTGLCGLVLIGSAVIRRPLMFALVRVLVNQSAMEAVVSRSMATRARAEFQSFVGRPWFRRLMIVMTLFYGLVAVAETAVLIVLVFSLPTERVLLLFPIVRNGTAGLLLLWTFLYFVPAVRRAKLKDEPSS